MEKSANKNNGNVAMFDVEDCPPKSGEGQNSSSTDGDSTGMSVLDRIAISLENQEAQLRRIADHFDPAPPEVVDSVFVANKLVCTTSWIGQLVRRGEIPRQCIVPGTGNGKPWKFHRTAIEKWIEQR